MSFTMSGVEGGWDYNRFDSLAEGRLGKAKALKALCEKCKGKGCGKCGQRGFMMIDRDDEDGNEGEGGDGGGAMGEGYMPLPTDKMARQASKAKRKEDMAAEKGDEGETNKQMKRRMAMMDPKGRKQQLLNKEELELVEEGRREGESMKDYARRLNKDTRKPSEVGMGKEYDPLNDPNDDGTGGAGYQKNVSGKKVMRMAAKRLQKEGLDPVGKEDGDVDNDGDKDSSDKYLLKRRKAIAKAMKKEEAELEMFTEKELDLLEDLLGK